MKKIVLFILALFIFVSNVEASECSSSELVRLRKLASQIKFETKYLGKASEDEFGIQISNMSNEFVVIYNNKSYINYKIVTGLKSKQKYRLDVSVDKSNTCFNDFSYVRYVTMPAYNKYYDSSYCDGLDIEMCELTYDSSKMTESQFKEEIDSYLESQNEVVEIEEDGFEFKYIIYGLVVIFVIAVIILVVSKASKKNNS